MLWPLADRPRLAAGRPGRRHTRPADRRRPGGITGTRRTPGHPAGGRRVRHRAGGRPGRPAQRGALPGRRSGSARDRQRDVRRVCGRPTIPTTAIRRLTPAPGQAAAAAWLDRLRALAHRMCVAPTPYAQADLDALHRVADTGLADHRDQRRRRHRRPDPRSHIRTRGATLLGDGSLTAAAADLLTAQGPTVAIAAAECTAQDEIDGKPRPANLEPAPVVRRSW